MFDRCVRDQAKRDPEAPAVMSADRMVSFGKLDADIDRAAAFCRQLAPAPGSAVRLAIADPYLLCVATLALARLGVATASAEDGAWRLALSDGSGAGLRLTAADLATAPQAAQVPGEPDPEAIGRYVLSSGTTGIRKRVGLSWRALDARIANTAAHYGLPDGPWLSGTGLGTTFGFNVVMAAWRCGQAVVLSASGALDLAAFRQFRPRLVSCIPQQLALLADAFQTTRLDTPLRIVIAAGSVPPPLARRVRDALTDDLLCIYGSTESGGVAMASLVDLRSFPAVAGRALPSATVEIVDGRGKTVPVGTLGAVRIATDRLASHYYDDTGQSTPVLRNGWFYPGDLGRFDGEGRLFVEGRSDDLMNIAGHKILPFWVEQAALACPAVKDAGAFSRLDADGLERCCLAIVWHGGPNLAALEVTLRAQMRWLSTLELISLADIPRNALGKIDRVRLRDGAAVT